VPARSFSVARLALFPEKKNRETPMNAEQHTPAKKEIWFAAKKYGYGWGRPTRWQGWLVILVYAVLAGAGIAYVMPSKGPVYFSIYLMALTVVLIAICAWKGEPARWRWGGK
jgi:hypothetical protein